MLAIVRTRRPLSLTSSLLNTDHIDFGLPRVSDPGNTEWDGAVVSSLYNRPNPQQLLQSIDARLHACNLGFSP